MNQPPDSSQADELDLTLEMLEHWERELDDFAMHIVHRLSVVTVPGDPSTIGSTWGAEENASRSENQQSLDLLRWISELNQ